MSGNKLMAVIAALAAGALVTASLELYRVFSYVAAGFILTMIATASIENRDSSFAPYNGLIGGLAIMFLVGLTGIWLLWNPSVTSYNYTLGMPRAMLVHVLFLFIAPALWSIYYALIFDRISGEQIVEDIISEARERQQGRNLPLEPESTEKMTNTKAVDGSAEVEGNDD